MNLRFLGMTLRPVDPGLHEIANFLNLAIRVAIYTGRHFGRSIISKRTENSLEVSD